MTSNPVIVREAIMPSGADLLPADKLTLLDASNVPLTVNFSLVTTPTPPIAPTPPAPVGSPNEGTVFYQLTDTPDMIAANVALGIPKLLHDQDGWRFGSVLWGFGPLDARSDQHHRRSILRTRSH